MVTWNILHIGADKVRLVRNILAAISFLLAFMFFLIAAMAFLVEFEGLGLAIGLTVFCTVAGFMLSTKTKRRINFETERELRGILESTKTHHLEGLPIAEKTNCEITLFYDRLEIVGGGINFTLSINQIVAAEVKTDVEIARIIHSSAMKGRVGGLLFGPIGLVVGSRATTRVKRKLHYYLVINYISSSGEVAFMLFQDNVIPYFTKQLVSKLKPMLPEKSQVTKIQL